MGMGLPAPTQDQSREAGSDSLRNQAIALSGSVRPPCGSEFRKSSHRYIGEAGQNAHRYSRTGIFNRWQLSTTERIAAIFGPACELPIWIQFFRPSASRHEVLMNVGGKLGPQSGLRVPPTQKTGQTAISSPHGPIAPLRLLLYVATARPKFFERNQRT